MTLRPVKGETPSKMSRRRVLPFNGNITPHLLGFVTYFSFETYQFIKSENLAAMQIKRGHKKRRRRSGAAVVEAAITLPIIFLVILSTVDICNRVFLRQSLAVIAYEAARVATIPGATLEDVEMQVETIAAGRAISDVSVAVDPSNFQDAPEGTFVTVSVTATGNQILRTGLFSSSQSSNSVSMMKVHE